jgi:hypothetical protein
MDRLNAVVKDRRGAHARRKLAMPQWPGTGMTIGTVVALLVLPSTVARAEVSGQLIVDGNPVKIATAYAYAIQGTFDPKTQDVVVVLCDVPVPPSAQRDADARIKVSKTGKLHCVEQTIEGDKTVLGFAVLHERFEPFLRGSSSYHKFEAKTFDGKTIAGRIRTSRPESFGNVPYSYDIAFSVPIAPLK